MKESNYKEIVAEILIDIESIKFSFDNPFTFTSGKKSPVYVDCRKIISFINERNKILDYAMEYFIEKKVETFSDSPENFRFFKDRKGNGLHNCLPA